MNDDNTVELVSMNEIAEITGLAKSSVRTYRKRGLLPEPLVVLACGPIWRRETIEEWAAHRRTAARA